MKMFLSFKFKTLVIIFVSLFCAALFAAMFVGISAREKNGGTEVLRLKYIAGLGIEVQTGDFKEKQVQIPLEFKAVYKNYNKLQEKAGYDLSNYKGVSATLYSYGARNAAGYTVNLLVYRGRIIGGDFSSTALDGEMLPLDKKEIERCLK